MVHIDRYDMEDYKSIASKLGKKHTASNYPCAHCTVHKQDLKLREYDAADKTRIKNPILQRHLEKQGT